jgi:hypothetical protein
MANEPAENQKEIQPEDLSEETTFSLFQGQFTDGRGNVKYVILEINHKTGAVSTIAGTRT